MTNGSKKSVFLGFVLAMFIAAALFGFLALASTNMMKHGVCPILLSFGIHCPLNNPFSLALHHLSGLKEFGRFILVISVFLVFSLLLFIRPFKEIFINQNLAYKKVYQKPVFLKDLKMLRWFSFHNKIDPEGF